MPKNPQAAKLRALALAYPGAEEHFPWGERVVKVKGKVFIFLGMDASEELGGSVKLAASHDAALTLPFASPTGYGLGKAGWVSFKFGAKEKAPLALLAKWLDESYRAIAPKTLVKQLDHGAPAPAQVKVAPKKAAKKKPRATKR